MQGLPYVMIGSRGARFTGGAGHVVNSIHTFAYEAGLQEQLNMFMGSTP